MTEQKERKELQNTNGYFLGKELAGTGGEGDKAWKRYKAKFKPRMESEKAFSFTCFGSLNSRNTKQLDELEEGTQYRICYVEEERKYGVDKIPYMSKTVIGFYSPDEKRMNPTPNISKETTSKLDLHRFDAFKEKYLETMMDNNVDPNVVHMLGSFIASYERERVAPLLTECKKALKK